MNTKLFASFATMLLLLASNARAGGSYRHVLSCTTDPGPSENELLVDFDNSTLKFYKDSTIQDLLTRDPRSVDERHFLAIAETSQSVTASLSNSPTIRLSDGKYYSVSGTASATLDRIDASYGLHGSEVYHSGWGHIFAVKNSGSPTHFLIQFQQSKTPPADPHLFLGSFYLALNPSCSETPSAGTGECSLTPTLDTDCTDETHDCPADFGRLSGVDLGKANNRYFYNIPVKFGCDGATCDKLLNAPPKGRNQFVKNTGGSAVVLTFGAVSTSVMPGEGTLPIGSQAIIAPSGGTSVLYLSGHEEDEVDYE